MKEEVAQLETDTKEAQSRFKGWQSVTDKAERNALKELAAQQSTSQTTTLGDLLKEKLGSGAGESGEES